MSGDVEKYREWAVELTEVFLPGAAEGVRRRSDLAEIEARLTWISALEDAAHFAGEELGMARRRILRGWVAE